MSTAVEVEDVTFAYGETVAVEAVSLAVEEGDFLGLIGPNGSGKTTLLHLMIGLKQPDSGTVRLFGEPAAEFAEGERIGYVSQRATDRSNSMPVSVREAVLMGRFPHVGHRRPGPKDQQLVDDALERVDIAELADRPIGELSGGQRQRTFIARALAGEADLLVLDEPTVGVDVESVDAFYDLLEALHENGITIVLIEHDLGAVTDHADRVVCLNGEIYFDGPTEEFVDSDALVRAFGAAASSLGDTA